MFVQETPTIPENNVYNFNSDKNNNNNNNYNNNNDDNNNNNNDHTTNYITNNSNYNKNNTNYITNNNSIKQDNTNNNNNSNTSASRSFGSSVNNSTSPQRVNGSPSLGRSFNQNQPIAKSNKVEEEEEEEEEEEVDGSISLVMIKPVMSPLQGTRVTMELNRPLPSSTTIKVGGKAVQSHVSEDNKREISFISPPLPSGFQSIEVFISPGKSVILDNMLQYENFIPQSDYSNVTHRTPPPSSGRVWGKKG